MKIEIGIFKSTSDGAIDVGTKLELTRTFEVDETKLAEILEGDISAMRAKILKFYQDKGQKIKSANSRGGLI